MEFLTTEVLASFITLSLLEIVLGIDNLIFITLVANGLPEHQRKKARMIGLGLALGIRIAMLFGVSWIMSLTEPLFTVAETAISIRDLLLIGGGAFLLYKTTCEMHDDLAGEHETKAVYAKSAFGAAVMQIIFVDLVFSFDSIITAIGMTPDLRVIIAAVVVSMLVMLAASEKISHFLQEYPTFKMLALSFILMIGTLLIAEGLHFHVPKQYIYFAFSFSIFVELLNTIARKKKRKRAESAGKGETLH